MDNFRDNKKKRPVYLNLFQIRLPVSGVVSILHRVTGVVLAIFLPVSLWVLQRSLRGPDEFATIAHWMSFSWVRVLLLLVIVAFAHHFFAGLRHLLLDVDVGISGRAARRSAWLVLVATAAAAVYTGAGWLW